MPVGVEPDTGDFALLAENPYRQGEPVQAVAAFMAPAHTALYTTAFVKRAPARQAPLLPLFAYTSKRSRQQAQTHPRKLNPHR